MIRRPPRSTLSSSSAASDVYKRQYLGKIKCFIHVNICLEVTVAKYLVQKSNSLNGEVTISGSKNAILPIMAAAILTMGALLARTGKARIALPGGCAIGARPIDLHLKGFQAMGATITEGHGYVEATAEKLVGANIYLDFPSVGATENIIMAASLAQGVTILENVAEEPEIVDLANFLNKMGAKIKGAGTDTIKIEGVKELYGTMHAVIPDRIETGTFMVGAAITRGTVLIKNTMPDHVKPIIAKLRECGVVVEYSDESILIKADINPLIATDIKTPVSYTHLT